jgi:hypothetical protein
MRPNFTKICTKEELQKVREGGQWVGMHFRGKKPE